MAVVGAATIAGMTGGVGEGRERFYQISYRVVVDSALDGPKVVRNALGIPPFFSPYTSGFTGLNSAEDDAGAFAVRINCRRQVPEQSRAVWLADVDYTSQPQLLEDPNETNDPTQKPVQWSSSTIKFQEPALFDNTGAGIANAANDPFDPPLMRDRTRRVWIALHNRDTLDETTWDDFIDGVNDAEFQGKATRKVKVESITWDERFRGSSSPYYEVRFEFHINDDTWDFKPLNRGFRQLVGGAGEPQRIGDGPSGVGGAPITQPAFLGDGNNGTTLGAVLTSAQVAAGYANFLTFQVYEEKDFSQLGLPTWPTR